MVELRESQTTDWARALALPFLEPSHPGTCYMKKQIVLRSHSLATERILLGGSPWMFVFNSLCYIFTYMVWLWKTILYVNEYHPHFTRVTTKDLVVKWVASARNKSLSLKLNSIEFIFPIHIIIIVMIKIILGYKGIRNSGLRPLLCHCRILRKIPHLWAYSFSLM